MVTITSHSNSKQYYYPTWPPDTPKIYWQGVFPSSTIYSISSVGKVPRQRLPWSLPWFPSSSLEQGSMPTEENLLRRTEQPVSPTKTPSDRDHRIYGSHRYIYVRFQHLPIKASHSLIRLAASLNSPSSPNQSTSKADRRKASLASWTGIKEQSIFRIVKEIRINR